MKSVTVLRPSPTLAAAIAIVAATTTTAAAALPQAAAFTQDRLYLGMWVGPPSDGAPAEVDQLFADVAAANFTFVMGGFEGSAGKAGILAEIAACKTHGLRVLPHAAAAATVADLPWDPPTTVGYQLADEPMPPAFPQLAAMVRNISTLRPGALGYINLLPDYGPFPTPADYLKYVEAFADAVPTPVLSFDSYPTYQRTLDASTGAVTVSDGRADYLSNLGVFRNVSLARNLTFWNYFNTMPFGGHADPSEDIIRWQAMAAIAYGAKGIMYFCYWTPPGQRAGSTFAMGNAILRPVGPNATYTKGPHYDHAKRINSVLVAWEKHLLTAVSTGVWQVAPGASAPSALAGSVLTNLTQPHSAWVNDFLVGQFELADGRTAVMVLSNAIGFGSIPTIAFAGVKDPTAQGVVEVDPSTGTEIPVMDEAPDTPGFQQAVGSAQARLYVTTV